MAIIDTFPYFNEKETLELRIKLLRDHVDKFIIIDADKTHRGDSKPFTCRKTLESLDMLESNITVIELEMPSYEEHPDPWFRERAQRNVACDYISDLDVCIVSDCDEIINPEFLNYYAEVAKKNADNVLRIPLYFLCGRADLRVHDKKSQPVPWNAPFLCMKSHLELYSLSEIRESYALEKNDVKYTDIFITEDEVVKEAGWHFSWMGSLDRLKTKVDSFIHYDEVRLVEGYSPEEGSTDPLGRKEFVLKGFPTELLPSLVLKLDHLREFFLPGVEG